MTFRYEDIIKDIRSFQEITKKYIPHPQKLPFRAFNFPATILTSQLRRFVEIRLIRIPKSRDQEKKIYRKAKEDKGDSNNRAQG